MKKKALALLLAGAAAIGAFSFAGCSKNDDGNTDGTENSVPASEGLEFTLLEGGGAYALTGLGTCEDTEVVIPSTYNGLPVTQIGTSIVTDNDYIEEPDFEDFSKSNLIFGLTNVTKVTVPDSVTAIGEYAFYCAPELTEIILGSNVKTISIGAFFGCEKLKSVNIPSGVTEINSCTFSCCVSLENVTLPSRLTHIGNLSFDGCTSLAQIKIPDSVTYVGEEVFCGCDNLIQTENDIDYVDGWATDCSIQTQIENLTLREDTRGIASYAFKECEYIKNITIPASVKYVGGYAFSSYMGYTPELSAITVDENNPWLKSVNNCILSKDGKSLYGGCKTSVIPEGVEVICEGAFYECKDLTSVTLPESLKRIEKSAFEQTSITSLNIPKNVNFIDRRAFNYNSALESITIDSENQTYSLVNNCIITKDGKTLLFAMKGAIIPEGVEIIRETACYMSGLSNAVLPSSLKSIENDAFYGNDFSSINIPASVTNLGFYSLAHCKNLKDVYYEGSKSEWKAICAPRIFGYGSENCTVHCTDGDLDSEGNEIPASNA